MSLSGKIVFASGKAGDFDIWSLDLEGQNLTQLTHGTSWNDAPKWSPDGGSIVFVSNRTGVPELWLMDEDGKNQRALTSSGKLHAEPCWTPDGAAVVCSANYSEGDNLSIYRIDLSNPEAPEQLIDQSGLDSGPCVSPDGKFVAFSATFDGNEDIWQHEIGTDAKHRLSTHAARDFSPRYSPDGQRIAFISERDEHAAGQKSADSDVWVMNIDGSDRRKVTSNTNADRYVCWSPDGQSICCCSSASSKSVDRINFIDVATGARLDFDMNRLPLEAEIDASVGDNWLLRLFPGKLGDSLKRMAYPENYFGTERFPDWKA